MELSGTVQNVIEGHRMSWKVTECHSVMECDRTLWNVVEGHRMLWNMQEQYGMLWHLMGTSPFCIFSNVNYRY